jgi:DNA-directed RNA polymerase specialized sigma subunit
MSAEEAYAQVIRQAAHDGVRALLAVPPDSEDGAVALRQVIAWLAREHGTAAVLDLAEELAVDLAEAFDALAAVQQRDPQELADAWFHDVQLPNQAGVPTDFDPSA